MKNTTTPRGRRTRHSRKPVGITIKTPPTYPNFVVGDAGYIRFLLFILLIFELIAVRTGSEQVAAVYSAGVLLGLFGLFAVWLYKSEGRTNLIEFTRRLLLGGALLRFAALLILLSRCLIDAGINWYALMILKAVVSPEAARQRFHAARSYFILGSFWLGGALVNVKEAGFFFHPVTVQRAGRAPLILAVIGCGPPLFYCLVISQTKCIMRLPCGRRLGGSSWDGSRPQ